MPNPTKFVRIRNWFVQLPIVGGLIDKLWTREVIAYLIVGGLTTLVNILVYHVCCNIMHIESLIANAIAWVAAVLFAYITNDKFVFTNQDEGHHSQGEKMIKFFGARLFSFAVDELGMFLLVDIIVMNNMIAKIIVNVLVVIINYFFSKLFIFK